MDQGCGWLVPGRRTGVGMNALTQVHIPTNATWIETSPNYFTVTLGHETRAITKEAPGSYIAWIGHQSRHWCFARALKACVDDIEYRLNEAALAQAAHDEAMGSLMRMTPAQRERLIARLTEEREMHEFTDHGRAKRLERQIERLRSI